MWGLKPLSSIAQSNSDASQTSVGARLDPRPSFVNTADAALPGAEEVIVDVPSVFHWARFQRGEINGWRYTLYPDGSANVVSAGNLLAVPIRLDCRSGLACTIARPDGTAGRVTASGAPRPPMPQNPDANAVAEYLAEWMLAGTGFSPAAQTLPTPKLPAIKSEKPKQVATVADRPVTLDAGIPAAPADTTTAAALPESTALTPPLDETTPEAEAVIVAGLEAGAETETAAGAEADQTLETEDGTLLAEEIAEDIPTGPAPLCAEPDPVMPSLCLDPPNREAPPEVASTDTDTATGTGATLRVPSVGDAAAIKTPAPKAPAKTTKAKKDTVLGRLGLDCTLTGSTSLGFVAEGSKTGSVGKPRLSLGCNSKITDKLSLRFSLVKYINAGEQSASDPDFTYSFTYRYSDQLTFNYADYSGQFGGPKGGIWNALNNGTLRASYKLPKITLPNDKDVACSTSAKLPAIFDHSLNISCGYAVTDKLRIGGTLSLYMPHKQGDYDPDYTYTASYRVNDDLLISYSNYSNNRWAWNRGKDPGPGFTGGSLSFTYGLKF